MQYIFIHGLGQTPNSWDSVIKDIEIKEKVVCPDLSAFGEYGKSTYRGLYGEFSNLCRSFEEKLCICGISLGAVLALNYAIEHSEKIASLILIAPQYKMPKLLLSFQQLLFHIMPRQCFQSAGLSKRDMISLTASMKQLDFSKMLSMIRCPTLIVCGEKDRVNKKAAYKLANRIESADLVLIEGTGHEVNKDNPRRLSHIISQQMSVQ